MSKARNYADEYRKFQSSPKDKRDRAKRNRDRARAMKAGRVHKGDGKEVDHIGGIGDNHTRVTSAHFNRGRRGQGGRRKGVGHKYPSEK